MFEAIAARLEATGGRRISWMKDPRSIVAHRSTRAPHCRSAWSEYDFAAGSSGVYAARYDAALR